MSSFAGLSVALSALQAQRRAMDVAGQNVANAATPGYTRQRADLVSVGTNAVGLSDSVGRGWTAGNGVRVAQVARLNDQLASTRLELATGDAATASTRAAVLSDVEARFGEPSDTGLSAKLAAVWDSWSNLGTADPLGASGAAARETVVAASREAAAALQTGAAGIAQQWTSVRTETETLVSEVNSTAAAVADLNGRIVAQQATGVPAHELSDQRDQLVLRLSQLVGARSSAQADGSVDVTVGGASLVRATAARELAVSGPAAYGGAGTAATSLVWADSSATAAPGGAASALTEALSTTLPTATAGYDAVATALAGKVNALHRGGTTAAGDPAGDVFTSPDGEPVTAATIRVAVTGSGVAAGTGQRDTSIAVAIAGITDDVDGPGTTAGPDATWRSLVITTGSASSAAAVRSSAAEASRGSAQAVVSSAAGVDIDSEMTDLLTFQRAYEGAARVLTAVDEALDTLINRTGLVGR